MGAFFKSFWRQLGRNTGNRVSNAIYGDKWSTPYRVAVDKSGPGRQHSNSRNKPRSRKKPNSSNHPVNKGQDKTKRGSWLFWIYGIILFAGTYNAILHPDKEDVLLIVMLWIVAIIYILFKYFSTRR